MPIQLPSKDSVRKQLDTDTKAFLRKGGKITQIAQGATNAKPTAFVVDAVKKREQEQR